MPGCHCAPRVCFFFVLLVVGGCNQAKKTRAELNARTMFSKHHAAFLALEKKARQTKLPAVLVPSPLRWTIGTKEIGFNGIYARHDDGLWRKRYGSPASRGPALTLENVLSAEGVSLKDYQACLALLTALKRTGEAARFTILFNGTEANIRPVTFSIALPHTRAASGFLPAAWAYSMRDLTKRASNKDNKDVRLNGNWLLHLRRKKLNLIPH